MSRLVIVSNRVADLKKTTQSGGLAVGLADALRERGGLWFGWNGQQADTRPGTAEVDQIGNVCMVSVPMTQRDYQEYYLGYSNSVLWPLCHYRMDLVSYRQSYFEGYKRVNDYFARMLLPHVEEGDVIWVHDYHLIPLAHCLRRRGCRQRIGFFMHIPFPPTDLLHALTDRETLVRALLAYDVVGFQTSSDAINFRRYVETAGLAKPAGDNLLLVDGREVIVQRFPIGIDVESFAEMATTASEEVRIDAMRRDLLGRRQIIGVDRLDYSKGLPDRFRAFDRLLAKFPALEKKVSFLQIAPPTREDVEAYNEIRVELEGLSGSINGRFSDFNWTPLRYIHRSVPRDKLAALFRASSVGLVTPLRDGMNLVAKEFVAAQDPEDPGVLVLSQFAGAAEEMTEAVLVNPYDIEATADAVHTALSMPLEERRERHKALFERISRQDARAWLTSFLRVLEAPMKDRADGSMQTPMVLPAA